MQFMLSISYLAFVDPLTAAHDYIQGFYFLLAQQMSAFKHLKDKTWHHSERF